VRVAAAERPQAAGAAHEPGLLVVPLGHRSVQRLDQRQPRERQPHVGQLARAGEGGEQVVDAGRDPLLGQQREQRLGIAPARLQLRVLALPDPEHVEVELAAGLELERQLLRHETVRKVREPERALDRVVIAQRHEVHPTPARPLVDLERVRVALAPEVVEHRHTGAARIPRVDVQVAAHQLDAFAFMATSRGGPATSRHQHWRPSRLRSRDRCGNSA
jgi:hypothetical protein